MARASVLAPGILIFSSLLASLVFAQDAATGAIHGTVVDPSGSRIAQASIVVVNTGTGTRYSPASDAERRLRLNRCLRVTTLLAR